MKSILGVIIAAVLSLFGIYQTIATPPAHIAATHANKSYAGNWVTG